MLQMKNVGFDSMAGRRPIHILSRVNLTLPQTGRVLVTGPAGSGKTVLLRLLSGRERPSRGEILIDGEPTSRWNDSRLAAWRRRVASAEEELLLPDRTVRENGELSLRLAGWRGGEVRKKAEAALAALGMDKLSESLPDELSGEERRLAAIACAVAREPEILILDEPLDGLSDEAARLVLDLLRSEAERRLVVVASRNGELFFGEDIRILELEDGELTGDSGEQPEPERSAPPAGLGGADRLRLALGALRRKSARTPVRLLTPFVVVLIMSLLLSALGGARNYAADLQAETLAAYPITLTESSIPSGDLESLAKYLESRTDGRTLSLQRSYAIAPRIFSSANGTARQLSPQPGTEVALWTELPDGESLRSPRYELVAGRWPTQFDEAVVMLNAQGNIDSACLNALGISHQEAQAGLTNPELLRLSFRVILPTDEYVQNVDGTWGFMGGDSDYMAALAARSHSVKIVGILKPGTAVAGRTGVGGAAYTADLTRWVIRSVLDSPLVQEQLAAPDKDVISGLPFDTQGVRSADVSVQRSTLQRYATGLSAARQAALYQEITGLTVEETAAQDTLLRTLENMEEQSLTELYDRLIASGAAQATLEENLRSFGATAAETVTALRLYAGSFAYRGTAAAVLKSYSEVVTYSDEAAGIIASGARLLSGESALYPALIALGTVLAVTALALAAVLPIRTRRREISLLRCRGLSAAAAAGALGWESLLLGLLGSAAGALLGMVIAPLVSPLLTGGCKTDWIITGILAGGGTLLTWLFGRLAAGTITADSPGEALRRNSL